jgi:hypothetical protein
MSLHDIGSAARNQLAPAPSREIESVSPEPLGFQQPAASEGRRLGRPPIAPALEKRIRDALATPGRPGIRVIAERFGVNPSTVQRISRPFDGASVAVA